MRGFGDPFCRKYFDWDDQNDEISLLFKALGKMKNSYLPLQKGDIRIDVKDGVMSIKRRYKSLAFTAIVNMSDESYVVKSDALICHNADKLPGVTILQKGGFAVVG